MRETPSKTSSPFDPGYFVDGPARKSIINNLISKQKTDKKKNHMKKSNDILLEKKEKINIKKMNVDFLCTRKFEDRLFTSLYAARRTQNIEKKK